MSDPQQQNVLIISSDVSVVEPIVSNNTTEQKINARRSVQEALSESGLFENNSIVIFDIATTENNVEQAIDQAIKLKQADPTQVLIIVGDKEPLNEILKSNIQPMVYRAFNKPVSPNQVFLAFKSANQLHIELVEKRAAGEDILVIGPQENKSNVDLIAEERKTNPLIFAGIGAFVLAVVAFIFLGGDDQEQPIAQVPTNIPAVETPVSEVQTNVNSKLDQLNKKAKAALAQGRLISPAGNNALEYFDQALIVDPYDSVAYEGRKSVANALRKSYDSLVAEKKYDDAFSALDKITSIDPLNPENEELQSKLEKAVTEAEKQERIASNQNSQSSTSASAIKKKIGEAKSASSNALQAEQVVINRIQSAIDSNNLIPPQANNAYTLLSNALRGKTISRANSSPLLNSLSSRLLSQANSSFNQNNLNRTTDILNYVNRIDVNNPQLADLRSRVNARKIEIKNQQQASVESQAQREAQERAARERAQTKIIPAKIISKSAPRYPSKAEDNDIEGWVQLTFKVNTKGQPEDIQATSSQPRGYFEEAAIKSIKKWTFTPAKNEATGEPVVSPPISTRISFKLDE